MAITWEVIAAFLTVLGFLAGVWFRLESKISSATKGAEDAATSARIKAEHAAVSLSEYKTHVAEYYVSKSGMKEATEQIMSAIAGLKQSFERMNERIDRLAESKPPRPRAT